MSSHRKRKVSRRESRESFLHMFCNKLSAKRSLFIYESVSRSINVRNLFSGTTFAITRKLLKSWFKRNLNFRLEMTTQNAVNLHAKLNGNFMASSTLPANFFTAFANVGRTEISLVRVNRKSAIMENRDDVNRKFTTESRGKWMWKQPMFVFFFPCDENPKIQSMNPRKKTTLADIKA